MIFWQVLLTLVLMTFLVPLVVGVCMRCWFTEKLRFMQAMLRVDGGETIFEKTTSKGIH